MYIDNSHNFILGIITTVLIVLPLLWKAFKKNLFSEINLKTLTHVFNNALLPQFGIGILLMIIASLIDKLVYSNGNGNLFTALLIESTYYYVVIGFFMYLPVIAILNLINLVNQKFKT